MTDQPKTQKEATKEAKDVLNSQSSEDAILKELLGNIPTTEAIPLELPSKNKYYNLVDAGSPISLRPMTFEDEKVMMSNKNPNTDVLNILLTRCVSNIAISNLLQVDKLYIIMKLREISYGDQYNATINCPGCRSDNNVEFNMSELNVNYADETFTNPVEVLLPVMGKKAKIRLPRIEDEQYFKNSEIAISNLWRFVEEIDGHTEKSVISKVIPQLPLKDAHALFSAMSSSAYGIDTKVRFVCNYCNNNEVMELPISADFFTGK